MRARCEELLWEIQAPKTEIRRPKRKRRIKEMFLPPGVRRCGSPPELFRVHLGGNFSFTFFARELSLSLCKYAVGSMHLLLGGAAAQVEHALHLHTPCKSVFNWIYLLQDLSDLRNRQAFCSCRTLPIDLYPCDGVPVLLDCWLVPTVVL